MLERACPILHVADMRRALAFYEGSLGFTCSFRLEDELHPEIPFAIVERDGVELHLKRAPDAAGRSACYVYVREAEALFAEFQRAGVTVIRPLEDMRFGLRDFTIADADGNHLGFAQPLDG